MTIHRILAVTAVLACASPALAQPTTGEQDMAAKANCSDYQSTGDGGWKSKDGKVLAKTDHMAIALQQKCSGGKK